MPVTGGCDLRAGACEGFARDFSLWAEAPEIRSGEVLLMRGYGLRAPGLR